MLQLLEKGDFYFVLGGDFNSRIADWHFTSLDSKDDFLDGNTFCRNTEDMQTNTFGKLLMDVCYMFQLTPVNGLVQGDLEGKYTYACDKGSSVIDLFLSSTDCIGNICSLFVDNRVESFHMPVNLNFSMLARDSVGDNERKCVYKTKWDNDKAHIYLNF
jgi:hypothetical protein